MPERILIIDDEPNIRKSFSSLLTDEGYLTKAVESAEAGLKACLNNSYDLILLDMQLPGLSGLEFLAELNQTKSDQLVLVISGQSDIPTALQAVRQGAVDFLEKPVPAEKLIASVRAIMMLAAANRQRELMIGSIAAESKILGESTAIRKLEKAISQVGPTESTVLITGENGTGKELAATQLFLQSRRRQQPFIRVNCPGIPETLFESELFGHKKGSFTGATKDHPGKFVMADNGTIFLDEIGDLPLNCQAKLLRVLESGEVETLGSTERHIVDVRIICATNQNLEKLVADGTFRQDLYYRISVFVLTVPSLATRTDDIPLLIGHFLNRYDPTGRTTISAEGIAFLTTQKYPGNVRQLKNCIERLTILYQDREIQLGDIQSGFQLTENEKAADRSLAESMNRYERTLIEQMLSQTDQNISEAARLLGIDRTVLSRKVKEYGLKK